MSILSWIDRSDRVRIEVSGPDRAKFLHNLCTNDIKRLSPGTGKEAFVTSPQGKTLGFVAIHALGDRLLVRSDPGTAPVLMAHFEKYGIFDDVTISDVSAATFEIHVMGDLSRAQVQVPGAELAIGEATIAGIAVRLIRESPAGGVGAALIGPIADRAAVIAEVCAAATAVELPLAAFDALRIAAGTPVFGIDIDSDNLPQELDRNARAISFVKGCYLGQETVARLDALGHVNKILRTIMFPDLTTPPPRGTECVCEGIRAGVITSAAVAESGGVAALAYLKTAAAASGGSVAISIAGVTHTGAVARP